MYDDVVKEIVSEIHGCLKVGIYDYEARKELGIFTQISGHDPDVTAQAYSRLISKLYDALSYFPDEKVGPFEILIITTLKTHALLVKVPGKPIIIGVIIPLNSNLGLARTVLKKVAREIS